ncbi:MAG: YitT family protein [Synergistaceae bacterium]|jgi:uncharacterized membrane-anchored protein YitT (DUF2179 family)|nr:YitT family protein [Synergistaceae bacterium]
MRNFAEALSPIKRDWKAILIVIAGNIITASAVSNFTLPYRFPDAGVTGVAVLTNYVFGISPGWVVFFGNMALLAWGWRNLDTRFLLLTILSIVVFTGFLPVFNDLQLPLPHDNRFMGAVISGVLKGAAAGMIFNVGGSGGGTDIVAMVLRRRRGIEVGQFSLYVNMVILAASLKSIGLEAAVYGVVSFYVYGTVLDNATRKFDRRKQAFIITNIPDEVSRFITSRGKGVTRLDGRGGYTGQPRPMLISLLEMRQVIQLKRYLQEHDPHAFVSICDASEVIGQGFKSWKSL